MPDTIMFVFAGRRPNMELQMPYLRRILDENPETQLHIWDLSRTPEDHQYIAGITGDRITIKDQFYDGAQPWRHFNQVWRHYAERQYQNHLFVKIDDDVVFLETEAFSSFIDAVHTNRGTVVSAKVINNGACTYTEPELWFAYQALGIPLLDVHQSAEYADLSHRWFFDNWIDTINHKPLLAPTEDWLSINLIGFDWRTCAEIAIRLDRPSPAEIAGRHFTPINRVGDEGSVNMLPRLIHEGFVAAHLTFGPQEKAMTSGQLAEYRKMYADIAEQYLS
ncbi:hypothetical protein OS122_02595 [Mycolicibacterium mucogenicum]|uniref:hypothetical protein n=1 Tax=Mycolicibacterium mucogenicum TaxID=56689 RepID=UPI00226A112B|nr:hypothetical protein [Mycolicibacterium mucogenicum]MCX8559788.1 hypothetical protein [Mycolicibacterium mucogenicum]